MCRLHFSFFFLLFTASVTMAQVKWFLPIGGNSLGLGDLIDNHANDFDGNIVAVGAFNNSIQLDGETIESKDESDMILFKTNASGTILWYKVLGGSSYQGDAGVAVDKQNNVYVVGGFVTDLYLGDEKKLEGVYDWNSFIAKFSPAGDLLWIKGIIGSARTFGVMDVSGDAIVIAANFDGTIDIAGYELTQDATYPNGSNLFIAKLNLDGEVIWVKNPVTESNTMPFDLHIGTDSSIYLTGFFTGRVYLETDTLQAANETHSDIFIVKLKPTGTTEWVKAFVKSSPLEINNTGRAIATDDLQNVYFTGHFGGAVQFGTIRLNGYDTEESRYNIFFTKLDSEGHILFAKETGAEEMDLACDLFYSNNRILFTGARDFGPFYTIYDLNGKVIESHAFENPGLPRTVTTDGAGNIFISGSQYGPYEDYTPVGQYGFLMNIFDYNAVGVDEGWNENELRVYPNPSRGSVTVGLDDMYTGPVQISLRSTTGMLMGDYRFTKSQIVETFQIHHQKVSSGLYYLILQEGSKKAVRKVGIIE